MENHSFQFDVLVVGGGHAGIEAALAASRLQCSVALLTQNLDTIGQMSCNPSIGGLAKGHIVREIDALGGAMAQNADATGIQFRMLNSSKGPSVRSPRAQCDKVAYRVRSKWILENDPNIHIFQGAATQILVDSQSRVYGVLTDLQFPIHAKSVVLCSGTFMQGLLHVGQLHFPGGRLGCAASSLSQNLKEIGFEVDRLKTGTSPRVNAHSINFNACTIQNGDPNPPLFSFCSQQTLHHYNQPFSTLNYWADPNFTIKQSPCWITYTNLQTHDVIRNNLHKSPLYSGIIEGIGPRYCPSIEDKIVRFADKDKHQIFIEPEGRHSAEFYLNGVSTSLPYEIQCQFIRTIPGLENAQLIRPGYAVEYDFCPPTQLHPSLETRLIENLYFAGQINGTSGYEEAASQGLVAGANAALKIKGKSPIVFKRNQAYVGVMIDDLVTKGTQEPYRMFTSRAEFRLLLRQDNADMRLVPLAYEKGLVDHERYQHVQQKIQDINSAIAQVHHIKYDGVSLDLWLKRAGNSWQNLPENLLKMFHVEHWDYIATEIQYEGHIARQLKQAEKMSRMDDKTIPDSIDYETIHALKREAILKLSSIRPTTIGQASRIPGITPADIAILLVWLKKKNI